MGGGGGGKEVGRRPLRATGDGSAPRTGSDDADGGAPASPPELAVVINLELGQPTMYEAFWREAGERAAVVIPGWWGVSYTSDAGSLCWFLEPEFEREVRRLHRLVGNALDGGDDGHIELVCSPNNPDGAIREAALSGKAIHDLVYYWPQYTPITGAAAHDIMLFTVSKVTGHAGTRLGWALVSGEGPRRGQEDGLLRGPEHHRRVQGLAAPRRQDPRRRLGRLRLRRRRRHAAPPLRLRSAAHVRALEGIARRRGGLRRLQPSGGDHRLLQLHQADSGSLPCVRVAALREGRRGGLRRVPARAQHRGAGRGAVRGRRQLRQDQHA